MQLRDIDIWIDQWSDVLPNIYEKKNSHKSHIQRTAGDLNFSSQTNDEI